MKYLLCCIVLFGMGCAPRYVTQQVKVPFLIKPKLPEALKEVLQNPCKFKKCWISTEHPDSKWGISSSNELLIRQYTADLKNSLDACLIIFSE